MEFALFLAPIVLSPGPNNILFSILGSDSKFQRVVPFFLATNLTVLIYASSVALFAASLNPIFESFGFLLTGVGSSYLLYLAYQLWKADPDSEQASYCPNFWEGLLFGFSNYKAIYAVLLAQAFWQSQYGALSFSSVPLFLSIFIGIGILGHILWFCSGVFLGRLERFARVRQRIFSLLLVGVALWLLL